MDYVSREEYLKKHPEKDAFKLENYPEHLRELVSLLLEGAECMSDGVVYYATVEDTTEFAQDIYDFFNKNKESK